MVQQAKDYVKRHQSSRFWWRKLGDSDRQDHEQQKGPECGLHGDRIILAGAFGSFIDPKYAMILGLIPDCDLEKVTAVGNAAGDGARIALLNKEKRIEAQEIAEWVRYVETAVDPDFQDEFVGAIHLPHASDPFPHLEGFLPEKKEEEVAQVAEGGTGRSRNRRRKKRR